MDLLWSCSWCLYPYIVMSNYIKRKFVIKHWFLQLYILSTPTIPSVNPTYFLYTRSTPFDIDGTFFRHGFLFDNTEGNVSTIAAIYQENTDINEMHIWNFHLGDSGAVVIYDALFNNAGLCTLPIQYCGIGDKGTVRFSS